MRSEPSAEVAYFTGVGLAQGARLAEAQAVLRKGIELGPESSDLAAQLVIVLADQGELAEAHRALDQAFERHADDHYLRVAESHLLLVGHDLQGALRAALESARLDPNAPEAHFAAGYAHLELEQAHEALAAFRQALELAPGVLHAKAGLAASLCLLERYDESLSAFREVLASDQDYFKSPFVEQLKSLYERASSHARA